MPVERLEGQATPGDEDESRDTVSDNLDVDFTTSVKKLPVIYPKGRESFLLIKAIFLFNAIKSLLRCSFDSMSVCVLLFNSIFLILNPKFSVSLINIL